MSRCPCTGARRRFIQSPLQGGARGAGVIDVTGETEDDEDAPAPARRPGGAAQARNAGVVDLTGETDDDEGAPAPAIRQHASDDEALQQAQQFARRTHNSQQPVHTVGGIQLTPDDFKRLLVPSDDPTERYLNDNVIEAWMVLLQKRADARAHKGEQDYFLSTTVGAVDASGARQFPRGRRMNAKVARAQRLFLPFHLTVQHWVLLVVDCHARTIVAYDSMLGSSTAPLTEAMGAVASWIDSLAQPAPDEDEGEKKAKARSRQGWVTVVADPTQMPQQTNGYDCGVYCCLCADYLSRSGTADAVLPKITPGMVAQMRERMALRILQGAFSLVHRERADDQEPEPGGAAREERHTKPGVDDDRKQQDERKEKKKRKQKKKKKKRRQQQQQQQQQQQHEMRREHDGYNPRPTRYINTVVEPGVEIEYVPSHLVATVHNFRKAIVVNVFPYPTDPDDDAQLDEPALRVVNGDTLNWVHAIRVEKDASGQLPPDHEEVFADIVDRRIKPGFKPAPDPRVADLRATRDLVRRRAAAAGLAPAS